MITWLKDDMGLITSPARTQELANDNKDATYLVPAFSGLGAPYWNSKCQSHDLWDEPYDRKKIVKEILESIAYQITDIVEMMKAEDGITVKELTSTEDRQGISI